MDLARGAGRLGAALDGPRADLLLARGEVRDEVEHRVARADHGVEAGLLQAGALEEVGALLGGQLHDLRLDLRADDHDRRAALLGALAHAVHERIGVGLGELLLLHVAHVEERLVREQREVSQDVLLVLVVRRDAAREATTVEHLLDLLEDLDGLLLLRVVALGRAARLVEALLHRVEILERELGLDGLDVGDRVDLVLDVQDVVVLEAAHDLRDRVALADVREEGVALAFALARAADQTRDVDEVHRRGHGLDRLDDLHERIEARVRHGHDAHVRLDRAERVVRGLGLLGRERVEERRLADVGQTDDADRQCHRVFSS